MPQDAERQPGPPGRLDAPVIGEATRDVSSFERLRSATRSAHASIETVPALHRLLEPELDAADYLMTLRKLHAFHAAFEPGLASRLLGFTRAAVLLDGRNLRALQADLAWFGASPLRCSPSPMTLPCAVAGLGALYVMEGSNLGGRIIARHVSRSLGVSPFAGGAFYGGLTAEQAGLRWQKLKEVLRLEIDQAQLAWEPAAAAALQTFGALEQWMRADVD